MSFAGVANKLRFIRRVWRERSALQALFNSGNYPFVKFAPPGHFYSPIPDVKEIKATSRAVLDRSEKGIPEIDLNTEAQVALAHEFLGYYKDIPFPDVQQNGARYYLDNVFFSYGDGVILYSMLRHFKPKRIIEVGSGFSSAAMLDVNDKFFNRAIDFNFIEPFPDRLLGLLQDQDRENCDIMQTTVQSVATSRFAKLQENDILFIDSSHVAKMHSDVVYLLFKILPSLNKGVIVHFHDILWPFEYPHSWIDGGRAWNEAYILRAFLQYNNTFQILYFNSMMEIHCGDFFGKKMPLVMKTPSSIVTPGNASLWIRKIH
jgi:hypothetical protein